MNRILNVATLTVVALVFSLLATFDASAVVITLNFVQSQSHASIGGTFAGLPFAPQDVDPPGPGGAVPLGLTDYDPAHPSTYTTFQGTITVDVDNLNAPTSIQILGSSADADPSGHWLPEVQPYLDRNGDMNFGEFGAPPAGDSCPATGAQPAECTPGDGTSGPAAEADWGIRNIHPSFGVDLSYGAVRDLDFNITMPSAVPVVAGNFASGTENFEFVSAWLDYWLVAAAGNVRGRENAAGDSSNNQSASLSSFTTTLLPGNQKEYKLAIPFSITDVGEDITFTYNGQFVATVIVPEHSTFVLTGMAMAVAASLGTRLQR